MCSDQIFFLENIHVNFVFLLTGLLKYIFNYLNSRTNAYFSTLAMVLVMVIKIFATFWVHTYAKIL